MGSPSSPDLRLESHCNEPADAYGLSKWRAENALREEFSQGDMSVIILRPALVYGSNAKGNLQRLAAAVRKGLPRPPAMGQRSMIAVQDLASLICCIVQQAPAGVHTWIACGDQAYSTRAIYDLLRAAGGRGRGVGWLPLWAWRGASLALDLFSAPAAEHTFDKLFGTELYSSAAVQAATGWRPRVRLEDVIGSMAATGPRNS